MYAKPTKSCLTRRCKARARKLLAAEFDQCRRLRSHMTPFNHHSVAAARQGVTLAVYINPYIDGFAVIRGPRLCHCLLLLPLSCLSVQPIFAAMANNPGGGIFFS